MAEQTFATRTEIKNKAGANVATAAIADAVLDDFAAQAESVINVATTFNWTDVYSTLDEDNRDILKAAASSWAARMAINYDMSGFSSTSEAKAMMDTLRDDFLHNVAILRKKDKQDFLNAV